MIVSINQPAYLPWLGYFHRIAASDLHVVLDDVQFERNSFTNRNKIRTAQGDTWLTVPVHLDGHTSGTIADVQIANGSWARKHVRTLEASYGRAPHWAAHQGLPQVIAGQDWPQLLPLLDATTDYLLDALGIRTRIVRSSDLATMGKKGDKVLQTCQAVGATTYLSGALGRHYLDLEAFRAAGIRVVFQHYHHPAYQQSHEPFVANLSAVDLLFNQGPQSLATLMAGNPRRDELATSAAS